MATDRVSLLLADLSKEDEASRAEACRTLGQLHATDAAYFVQKVLDDPRPSVHASCLYAFSVLGGPNEQPMDLYYQALHDPSIEVRAAGAGALGHFQPMPDQAIRAVGELLDRETNDAVKERSMLCNIACSNAQVVLKQANTPEARAALQRMTDGFRSIGSLVDADQEKRTQAFKAEQQADAAKVRFLGHLPWIALGSIVGVFILSGIIRLFLRKKDPS